MPAEFQGLFKHLIDIADAQRPGYRAALGGGLSADTVAPMISGTLYSDYLVDIYSLVRGTRRRIAEQHLMDLIPGYRLVELHEVAAGTFWEKQRVVPLLSNYSSDHIAFMSNKSGMWRLNHDDDRAYKIYDTPESFVRTASECFQVGAYSLDSDGFLDYDAKKVSEIATQHNPNSDYWK